MNTRKPHNKWVVYIDKDLTAQVKMKALTEEKTVGEWISELIRKAL